jgi:hypothetical protein
MKLFIYRGVKFTEEFYIYFKSGSDYISAWHDIPLYADLSNKVDANTCKNLKRH